MPAPCSPYRIPEDDLPRFKSDVQGIPLHFHRCLLDGLELEAFRCRQVCQEKHREELRMATCGGEVTHSCPSEPKGGCLPLRD